MRCGISNRIHEGISFVKGEDSIEGQEIHEDGLHGSKVYLPLSTRRASLNYSIKGAVSLTTSLTSSGLGLLNVQDNSRNEQISV